MIADNPPVVPVVALPAGGDLRAEAPAAPSARPVTAEEVAALARRIRVEAKTGRIAVVGTALGIVCGGAAVWPFLGGGEYMAESLSTGDEVAAWGFLPSWLLAGLLPLLAFYAGRLHFESGRASTDKLEASLRKLRRIILGCMFASMASFVSVVAHRHSAYRVLDDASWVMFIYAGCFVACGFIVGDVRRGLGDFDSEQQRRRRRLARGFAVELAPTTVARTPGDAPADDDVPLATLAAPHAVPPVAALPILADAGEDDHARDLRLLMTLAIAIALGVHAVRLGSDLAGVMELGERVASSFLGSMWGNAILSASPVALLLMLLAMLATILLAPCAVLWIVWGILSLNYGPAWRRTIGWLAAVTLVLAVVCVLPGWVYGMRDLELRRSQRMEMGMLGRAPEIVHALFIGLLLTRPGVKRLFARSSRLDDSD